MSCFCCKKVASSNDADIVNGEGDDQVYAQRVTNAFGYTVEELQSAPTELRMGLSCENPVATPLIREGEIVLYLGSSGVVNVFLAADKVGPTGQVIVIDNSDDVTSRARRNAADKGLKPPHVAFVKAALTEDLPIETDSVDCILSNLIVNLLSPAGKLEMMQEIYRVLKPGGRVRLDDIVASKPFPDALRSDIAAQAGYISGAILLQEYEGVMRDVGFEQILFTENQTDLNVCCGMGDSTKSALSDIGDLNNWAKSYRIDASKSSDVPLTSDNSAPPSALKNVWDAYPAPVSSPSSLECEEVADLIRNRELGKKDFAVFDVRGDDHAGGHIRGSTHRPALTFLDDLDTFYEEYKNTKKMIFYCGSSHGRGPRCAGWYQDYLNQQGNTESRAFAMMGGASQWVSSYKGQEDLVDFD